MIIDQRIKRKHIFTACNRTCMESRLFFFFEKQNSRLWEHNSDSNKKGAVTENSKRKPSIRIYSAQSLHNITENEILLQTVGTIIGREN